MSRNRNEAGAALSAGYRTGDKLKSILTANRTFAPEPEENHSSSDTGSESHDQQFDFDLNSRSQSLIAQMTTDLGLSSATDPVELEELPSTKITRNYSCGECGFYTQNARVHLYHYRDVHGDKGKIYECTACVYASKHVQKLQRHIRMCHGASSRNGKSSLNGNGNGQGQSESRSEADSKSDSSAGSEECEAEFDEEENTNGVGNGNETTPKPTSKVIQENSEVNVEVTEKLSPSGRQQCPICAYETSDAARYKKHLTYHVSKGSNSGSGMTECNLCDFQTPYKWNLDRHLRNHGHDGLLKCPVCTFSADIKQSITVHIQNHHRSLSPEKISELIKAINGKPVPESHSTINDFDKFNDSLPILVTERGELDSARMNLVNPEDILEKNGKIYFKKLRCPKPNCGFRAVWDTELNRHLSSAHSVPMQRKSMPILHPISPPRVLDMAKSAPPPSPRDSRSILKAFPRARPLALDNLSVRVRLQNQRAARATKNALHMQRQGSWGARGKAKAAAVAPAPISLLKRSLEAPSQSRVVKKEEIVGEVDVTGVETSPGVGVIGKVYHQGSQELAHCSIRKVYKCRHANCNFWATSTPRFHMHMIDHSKNKPFHCSKCNFRSHLTWEVAKHIRTKGAAKDLHHTNATVLGDSPMAAKDYRKNLALMTLMNPEQTKSPPPMQISSSFGNSANLSKTTLSGRAGTKCPNTVTATATATTAMIKDEKPEVPDPTSVKPIMPKMPTLTRAPTHVFAAAAGTMSPGLQLSPPTLKPMTTKAKEGRTLVVETKMLSGGHILVGEKRRGSQSDADTTDFAELDFDQKNMNEPVEKKPRLSNEALEKEKSTPKTLFKCRMCPFQHENKLDVRQHVRMYHQTETKDIKIAAPSPATALAPTLKTNESKRSRKRRFLSPRKLNSGNVRETHQYKFEDGIFSCKFCPFKTPDTEEIGSHSEHHFSKPNNNFSCDYCSFSVRTQAELSDHIVLHTYAAEPVEPEGLNLAICADEIPPKPAGAGSDFKKYHCMECPYTTDSRGQFQYHRQFHVPREDSPFTCDQCSYSVSHKHLLHQHSRVHFSKGSDGNGTSFGNSEPEHDQEPDEFEAMDVSIANGTQNGYHHQSKMDDTHQNHPKLLVWRDGVAFKVFRCHSCPQIFEDLVDLLQHENSHAADDDSLTLNFPMPTAAAVKSKAKPKQQSQELPLSLCKFCPGRFSNANDFVVHSSFHRIKSPFKCPHCSYSTKSESHLESHMKVHSMDYQKKTQEYFLKVNKIKCPKCPARLANEPSFQQHYGFHGRYSEHSCRFCDFGATSQKALILHEYIHSLAPSPFSAAVATATVTAAQKPQARQFIASGETTITLEKIPTLTTSPKATATSMRAKAVRPEDDEACEGNPNFVYPTFEKNGKMKEKRYKCKLCPSAFEKRDQYNVHLGLHGSNQRYICTICDYSVTYFANFAQHLKKHESQPEISKELLLQLGTPLSKLGRQTIIPAATTTKLRCRSCPFSSEDEREMQNHELQHGRNSPSLVPCQFCDFAAIDKKDLLAHTKCHFQSTKPDSYMFAPQGIELMVQRTGQKIYSEKDNRAAAAAAAAAAAGRQAVRKLQNSVDVTYVDMAVGLPINMIDDEDDDEEDEYE